MKYLLMFISGITLTMDNNGAHYPRQNSPRINVECSTRVIDSNTTFIDENNTNLVSDNQRMVEVVLRIHRTGRPVKVITLNVDI